MRSQFFFSLLFFMSAASLSHAEVDLVETWAIGVEKPVTFESTRPPEGFVVDAELGLLRHRSLQGQVVHTARKGVRGLFETRAVRTPKGDLLLMFPEGNHYAAGSGKLVRLYR